MLDQPLSYRSGDKFHEAVRERKVPGMKYRRMIIRIGAALACLSATLLASAQPAGNSAASKPSAGEIRIGAWNIEWLGAPNSRSGPAKGVAQKAEDIARCIDAANVDLLALEEIGDDDGDDAKHTNKTLDAAFAQLSSSGSKKWQYRLFEKKDPADKNQLTGVAWNSARVSLVGEPLKIPVIDRGDKEMRLWDRHPQATKFSFGDGKTDVVLIPVHMKSNRGGTDETSRQRLAEARALMEVLGIVREKFHDDDIIIAGDFNMLKADEPGLQVYAAMDFTDLNHGDTPTTTYRPAPFDRFLFRPAGEEFSKAKFETTTANIPDEEFRVKLSDHRLVVTTIAVGADDD